MAADRIKLRLGGRDATLHRSTRFVGLRPGLPGEAAVDLAVETGSHPQVASASFGSELGGFRLLELAAMPSTTPSTQTTRQLDLRRADDLGDVATAVYHSRANDLAPLVPTGEIHVRFVPDASDAARQELLDRLSLTVLENRGPETLICRTSATSSDPVAVAKVLQNEAIIADAEPSLATFPERLACLMPNDQALSHQWHLRNQGSFRGTAASGVAGADARVVAAWEAAGSLGSPKIIVAVIDDGFDLTHPDLKREGKIVHPRDFGRGGTDPSPSDRDWHGTACAGIVCAGAGAGAGAGSGSGAAGGYVLGAAPGATLMPIRWGPDLSPAAVERWFDYVTEHGAAVVSCSWKARPAYYPLHPQISEAIARCARRGRGGKGCVVVFGAGNDRQDIDDPAGVTLNGFATHPDVIAVAACNSRDKLAEYSNFGDAIWISAPSSSASGWGVLQTDVTGSGKVVLPDEVAGGNTWIFGGTSSSTPLVAGIAALMLSANPELTAAEVRSIIARTARRIGPRGAYHNGRSRYFGHGCIDAEAAVRAALGLVNEKAPSSVQTLPETVRHFRQSRKNNAERDRFVRDHIGSVA